MIFHNNTTSCNVNILNHDGFINLPWQPPETERVGLLGTTETVVNRYLGESNEVEYECWLFYSEYAKLLAMIAAQTDGNRIVVSGIDYNVELAGAPKMTLGSSQIVFVSLALKGL